MKSVLITGGAGFIGTALAYRLKDQGVSPVLLDFKSAFKKQHQENFETVDVDIRDYANFQKLKLKQFQYIYHLAAQSSARVSHETPELDVATNILGTMNVCRYALGSRSKKIIFSSTMGVYASSSEPISENTPTNPESLYGIGKFAGEQIIKMHEQQGINNSIFRLFNVYGPGQDYTNTKHGMASIFTAQMLQKKNIEVTGSLDRFRDFVYIDDVLDALQMGEEKLSNDIYNVGSSKKTTCHELLSEIATALGKNISDYSIQAGHSHAGDVFGTVSSNAKLMKCGWTPRVSLREGVVKMCEDAKGMLK